MLDLLEALDEENSRFMAACMQDDPQAAHDAYHAVMALMNEHRDRMREDLRALSKRKRLRKEGR